MIIKKLRLKECARDYFLEDVKILKKQLEDAGYSAREVDISYAWENYSSSRCAQWLCLHTPEENVKGILEYFEVEQ